MDSHQYNNIRCPSPSSVMTNSIDSFEKPTFKRTRRVQFNPSVTCAVSQSLPFEELKDLWYQPMDLFAFKAQARQLARSNSDDDLRGLEYCTPERLRHKHMTIRCTLSCQKKGISWDQTAMVSRKCTAWNERVAFEQARHDYYSAYNPSARSMITQVPKIPPAFPFAFKKRVNESGVSQQQQQRCVRRRTV